MTLAVRFSPDGKQVAMSGPAIDHSYLVVVDTTLQPPESVLAEVVETTAAGHLLWMSSGLRLICGNTFIRISDKTSCSASGILYPAGPDTLVTKPDARHATLLDTGCKPIRTVDVAAVTAFVHASVDPWAGLREPDSPGIECRTSRGEKRRVTCIDKRSGVELFSLKEWPWTQYQARPARDARRAIVSEYSRTPDLDLQWVTGALRKRSVWDINTGKELASWKPKGQEHHYGPADKKMRVVPDPVDISPDGQYIAEAHSGILSLYHVEP